MEPKDEGLPCRLSVHQFSGNVLDQMIHFYVLSLKDSIFLCIGQTPKLENLAMAMVTKYGSSATGTNIMGDKSDTTSTVLAQKLAKRMKKQVFVSNNIVSAPGMLNMPLIEQRIIKELTEFPDKFGY